MALYGQPFRYSFYAVFSETRSQMAKWAIQPIKAINSGLAGCDRLASLRNEI